VTLVYCTQGAGKAQSTLSDHSPNLIIGSASMSDPELKLGYAIKLGSRTTGDDIGRAFGANIQGLTVLITGATGGLGLETAKVIAKCGGKVVIGARNDAKAALALVAVRESIPAAMTFNVSTIIMDLSDLSTVRAAAEAYVASGEPLDVLINNAGIMATPYSKTKQGFESQFGVNHLAHFELTNIFLPLLRRSKYARVINLSSIANYIFADHNKGINFAAINSKKGCSRWGQYGLSKLCNILHAREITRRELATGSPVIAYAVHPGCIAETGLMRFFNAELALQFMAFPRALVLATDTKSISQGVSTTLYAAMAPKAGMTRPRSI
jgi:NAD(P)-dependent dehydrogenase (short-subunit alcohol dehydrogenase family)